SRRRWPDAALAGALHDAPGFVMAHVLQAWRLLGSRDPQRVRAAQPVLAAASALPANERERMHLAAIAAVSADDYQGAKARLGELLSRYPRDVLALQAAHSFDYLTGETQGMRQRIEAVLPAWSNEVPGYSAVLAMHAFALEECGEYARAEQAAGAALAIDPGNARAHHAMAHVFEMTGRPEAGARWMTEHVAAWSEGSVAATHCWWHLALFVLAQGQPERALALYDQRLDVRAGEPTDLADLVDACALLWRLRLLGHDGGARWGRLAAAWEPHIDDGYCSFTDVHAMLAFVGAEDDPRAQRLERALMQAAARPTRHGATTRALGLPGCRALRAFGHGNDVLAVSLLAGLPALAHQIGGSHAQRDVLHLTLTRAVERIRRPPSAVHRSATRSARSWPTMSA
ncbi:MAG TPA: tetratricopeptide repeat protein, partial [Burkholderiaceae bacterium]|nr:tetratricopeptide repeat protein [Burkholderiaceae bacterium]